ncbi:MAG: beta-lactamase family protein [Cyanobacteria bacterium SZAS LIN-3]|nr:beta-lactamase family protein [Cyanobacteria bacterium SZAS LIN-3]
MQKDVVERTVTFLKSWLSLRYEQCDLPGFAVAVTINNELVLNEAFGYADLASGEKLTTDHIFRVASHSKTFTGTALMQLSERGLLQLDAPVVKYLPWLAAHKDKRMANVTTRQLLCHSAGIIRDGLDADCWLYMKDFPDQERLKRELLEADLVFDCNLKMKYSNHGYGMLGLIVEAVSGATFHQYVQENIISPLGLKNTGPEVTQAITSRLASGYSRSEWVSKKTRLPLNIKVNTRALAAATGFYSTAADLCTYFSAHIQGSGLLLNDETKKEMQRTQWPVTNSTFDQEYGLGLQVDLVGTRRVIGHAGAFPGMATRTLCDPAAGMVVSVLTNCIDADPTAICRAVYAFFDHFESNARAAATISPERLALLDSFRGRFVNLFKVMEVLPRGEQLVGFDPSSWMPLMEVEELQVVDAKTLKMTRANGFAFEGEPLKYTFGADGRPEKLRCGGYTMHAEEHYGRALDALAAACGSV